jgi:hypothetical protein
MRRPGGWDEKDAIKFKLFTRMLSQSQVAIVNWIERPA